MSWVLTSKRRGWCPFSEQRGIGRGRGRGRDKWRPVRRAPHRLRGSTFGVVTENGFHLEEVFEAVMTPFATVARLLVATEGRVVVQRGTVEMDHAGANLTGDIARAFQISGGDVAGQPVAGVIGDADGVCLILVADDRQHGSEDLLTGDGHVVGDMAEHGGLDVIAAIQPLGTTGT